MDTRAIPRNDEFHHQQASYLCARHYLLFHRFPPTPTRHLSRLQITANIRHRSTPFQHRLALQALTWTASIKAVALFLRTSMRHQVPTRRYRALTQTRRSDPSDHLFRRSQSKASISLGEIFRRRISSGTMEGLPPRPVRFRRMKGSYHHPLDGMPWGSG